MSSFQTQVYVSGNEEYLEMLQIELEGFDNSHNDPFDIATISQLMECSTKTETKRRPPMLRKNAVSQISAGSLRSLMKN
jgi:hypothetical protein